MGRRIINKNILSDLFDRELVGTVNVRRGAGITVINRVFGVAVRILAVKDDDLAVVGGTDGVDCLLDGFESIVSTESGV